MPQFWEVTMAPTLKHNPENQRAGIRRGYQIKQEDLMNIQQNISLRKLNTFGIDVVAQYFASFDDVSDIEELLEFRQHPTSNSKHQIVILGGGSNMLFTRDVEGIVMKNDIKGIEVVKEDAEHIYVRAGAGENWHQLVLYCIRGNYAGMENLSLIPGNVGASPMQNIGAYGVEIKDVFYELEAFHLEDKKLVKFSLADCEFGYRESVFKRKYKGQFIITSVTYKLNKVPQFNTSYGAIEQELKLMGVQELSIAAISQAVINIRSSKLPDPAVIGNAGSFFKNPEVDAEVFNNLKKEFPKIAGYPLANGNVKLAAGWLIEHSGPDAFTSWKGYRKGDAGCHINQALVLVNYGAASGQEILALSQSIINSVSEKYGLELEREVNII